MRCTRRRVPHLGARVLGDAMVKFGRRLVSERHEEWAEYYIDYKVRRGKNRRVN